MSANSVTLALAASVLSGFSTALFAAFRDRNKEKKRVQEKAQDDLKLELKDLQIKLFKVEKDLDEWKSKYYDALQELIAVKSELEKALINLQYIELEEEKES
jgi:hypothetical protein